VVFVALDYSASLTLAVLAGIPQFVPVVGPSVVIATMAVMDLVAGNTQRAVLVLVIGGAPVAAPRRGDPVPAGRVARRSADEPLLYRVRRRGPHGRRGRVRRRALAVALVVEVTDALAETEVDGGLHRR